MIFVPQFSQNLTQSGGQIHSPSFTERYENCKKLSFT